MNVQELKTKLVTLTQLTTFTRLYGTLANANAQVTRYLELLERFVEVFGEQEVEVYSAPGRSEIGGNHTDHQNGLVLAAAIHLDAVAIVSKSDDFTITLHSEGFDIAPVDLSDCAMRPYEHGKSEALIRGIVAKMQAEGYRVGGFKAVMNSQVLSGSGLSSSAAFEVLVGTILSHLYNEGSIAPMDLAKIGQYAENVYFGKPCGLLDQATASVGGFVTMDFYDNQHVGVEKVDFDFNQSGHALCIVDTGGNHADLTQEYAAVPQEMRSVASMLGVEKLSHTSYDAFLSALPQLRKVCSDRALLRAFHLFQENARVVKQVKALRDNDFETFKQLILESGHSSFEYLQNVFPSHDPSEQGVSLGLALSQHCLQGVGAWRVHGGGFAGTIQAFVPNELVASYKATMEQVFGAGCVYTLYVRPVGGVKVF